MEGRAWHTQSGLVACGCSDCDIDSSDTCITFSEGEWRTSHSLRHWRSYHSSWSSAEHGTILIGGHYGQNTTEILTDDGHEGGSLESFPLKYST